MQLEEKEKRGFLKDEYLLLQNQYEDFDRRSLTIKGWIGSGAAASLALSFNSTNQYAFMVPIFVAVIAAVFWYLETCWKMVQYSLSDRIRIIEAYFRGDADILEQDPVPFQTYHAWFKSFAEDRPIYPYERKYRSKSRNARFWEVARQGFVCALYAAIIALSLVSFVVLRFIKT